VDNLADGINATGIDITNRQIQITADKFYLYNNSGDRVLNVDSNGNLVLTGIVKPKNIQLECKQFSSTPTIDPSMPTDDIYRGFIQSNQNRNLLTATVKSSSSLRLTDISISAFEINGAQTKEMFEYTRDYGTDKKHRFKITATSSGS
jgi:hypothetical protein